MALSLNEIRDRALAFAREWADETSESAEAKSFWDGFFDVFGISRRRVASFEQPVRMADGHDGYIDLLWRGKLLVEHKSAGKDLSRAKGQALEYFSGLNERDLPRFVVVSDFARIRLYDLDESRQFEFLLKDLPSHIDLFGFISGYEKSSFEVESEANEKAAEQLGALHELLEETHYSGHPLEVLMVRLLFCLFADDTLLFEKGAFREYIEQRTGEDGSDLGPLLQRFFDVLNTPPERRSTALDEQLAKFRYINGRLFDEKLPFPEFNSAMRNALLSAARLSWSKISPAIFGSLFQSIMEKKERRERGAHYTSEENILKSIRPLFIDELRAQFERCKNSLAQLREFHSRLAGIRILDPACGCGNFLVIAYRELRLLELDVVRVLQRHEKTGTLDLSLLFKVDVDQFYGIEIDEWPARIAEVAMWMMDHQMNMMAAAEFGKYYVRLPLKKSPNITHGNALRIDWSRILPVDRLTYIVGNPPFSGSKKMSEEQREDMRIVFSGLKSFGSLDYVAAWYWKAAEVLSKNEKIEVSFVSTNSITQGEQPDLLWKPMIGRGVQINFAHRTFAWTSEGRGKAVVYCVIIGFANFGRQSKILFDYKTPKSAPFAIQVSNINPYLVNGPNITLPSRSTALSNVPKLGIGNKPIDGGWYLFTPEERAEFISKEPNSQKYFRRWLGSEEFINGIERWILFLRDASSEEISSMPLVYERVRNVQQFRRGEAIGKNGRRAKDEGTAELAKTPTRFHVENIPLSPYLIIPRHSSEGRLYIPIEWAEATSLCGDANLMAADAELYHFGVLTSTMHMSWVRAVCGRIKSDVRYSVNIVYNNFVWPTASDRQKSQIERAARMVIDVREKHVGATLANLYDPVTMPSDLVAAHAAVDAAVDAAYGGRKFKTEADRVAFMLEQYQAASVPLISTISRRRRRPH